MGSCAVRPQRRAFQPAERTPIQHVRLSAGAEADVLYRGALGRLERTTLRTYCARTHLVYGEWLRRHDRRSEAREQLRIAHRTLSEMGLMAFAERAARELEATGEH